MMRHAARFAKRTICACGHPILAEHLELGTPYVVHPDRVKMQTMQCGGCGEHLTGLWVWVEARGISPAGFLPVEIFDIDEGAIK